MRRFPLLPDEDGLVRLVNALELGGWNETLEISASLAALVSDAVILVNREQTSTISFLDEGNHVGVKLVSLAYEEGDRDLTILEVHNASVSRLYAILDVCGILQVQSDWLTWFREQQWGDSGGYVTGDLVVSGVIDVERRDGFSAGGDGQ